MPPTGLPVEEAARLEADAVLTRLASSTAGLSAEQAATRLRECGPNAVRSHHARALGVLGRQLRSPVLLLLAVTAAISATIGNTSDVIIIGVILLAGVALGFVNEYRAERAAASLHDLMRHTVAVVRDGHPARVDVKDVVPGDVVRLAAGVVVPADIRLLEVASLDCDESVVDRERVLAPSHWDVAFIRRFMVFFEPLSSLFDFMIFAAGLPGGRGRHGPGLHAPHRGR